MGFIYRIDSWKQIYPWTNSRIVAFENTQELMAREAIPALKSYVCLDLCIMGYVYEICQISEGNEHDTDIISI